MAQAVQKGQSDTQALALIQSLKAAIEMLRLGILQKLIWRQGTMICNLQDSFVRIVPIHRHGLHTASAASHPVQGTVAHDAHHPCHRLPEIGTVSARLLPDIQESLLQDLFGQVSLTQYTYGNGQQTR
jgi:hypothetical protein